MTRMRNLADFATAVSRLEGWLREHARALNPPVDARGFATKHLVEHGNVWDDPSRKLCACAHCGTTFTMPTGQPAAACPQCGHRAAPLPHGGEPPAHRICGCVRAWGQCGYRSDCKVCGASAVLFDLELALADRSSRSHTLDLVHHLTNAAEAADRAESEYERARVARDFQQSLPAAVDAFLHGQARHREESIQRVRSQVEAMQRRGVPEGVQLRGQSPADLESLFPMISPREVVARILESTPVAEPDKWSGSILGLVNARESLRRAHVDPDRSLLGGLQDHLRAHGFSYSEIAHLLPDGEGGTQHQQRNRVKNRLQHRRRER